MQEPQKADWHALRIAVACRFDGTEPVQGALADAFHAGMQADPLIAATLDSMARVGVLPEQTLQTYRHLRQKNKGLPHVNTLATRWSVLTSPSLDVPVHGLLCGRDDANTIAAAALMAILAGEQTAEEFFLEHCAATNDVRSFMVVRSELNKKGHPLSPRWAQVSETLQDAVDRSYA